MLIYNSATSEVNIKQHLLLQHHHQTFNVDQSVNVIFLDSIYFGLQTGFDDAILKRKILQRWRNEDKNLKYLSVDNKMPKRGH